MLILKAQALKEDELLQLATSMSRRPGWTKEKLLHWDFGPVMEMRYDAQAKNYLFSDEAVPFHWDGAFHVEPEKILFYCTETSGKGGETLFTDTERIWNSLSSSEQELLRKVTLTYETEKLAHYGGKIKVPLVQRHPVTGKTILRMAERVDSRINPVTLELTGVDDPEGIYEFVRQKLYHKEFIYQHAWEKGDLLVCDNFTYLHGRRPLGENKTRTFKRIQIL